MDVAHGALLGRRTALGLLGAAALPVGRAAAATHWDCYIYNAVATLAASRGVTRIIDDTAKQTDGGLNISMHLGGSLMINTTTITQAVSDGVVQMGDDGYFLGNVPIAGVLRLPLLIRTPEEYAKAAAIMEPYVTAAFEKKGVVVLGTYLYPFQVAFSRKELTRLADIKGQKIRVTSPEQGEFIRRLGGVPVTLGAPDVPSALDRGVVDGVLTATSGGGLIWKDLLKYNYRIGINYFNSLIIANREAFEALPQPAQAALRSAATSAMPWITQEMEAQEEDYTAKMQAGGLIVTAERADDVAEATKTVEPYWSQWAKAKGPEATEALQKVRAALGR